MPHERFEFMNVEMSIERVMDADDRERVGRYGAQGWDLVAVTPGMHGDSVFMWFKRVKRE